MKKIRHLFLFLFLIQLTVTSCEKEEDIYTSNLTRKTWTLMKLEKHTFINEVLDTIRTWSEDESIKFSNNGIVEYTNEFILEPSPMIGKWWFSENKKILNTDLKIIINNNGYPILINATIIELTNISLVLKTEELYVSSSINNENIKYLDYKYYSN